MKIIFEKIEHQIKIARIHNDNDKIDKLLSLKKSFVNSINEHHKQNETKNFNLKTLIEFRTNLNFIQNSIDDLFMRYNAYNNRLLKTNDYKIKSFEHENCIDDDFDYNDINDVLQYSFDDIHRNIDEHVDEMTNNIDLQFVLSNEHDITKLQIARTQINEYFLQNNVDDIDNVLMYIDTTIRSLIETNQIATIELNNK